MKLFLKNTFWKQVPTYLPTNLAVCSPQRIPATMINKGLLYGFFYRKTRKPDVFRKSDEGASRHHVRLSDQTDRHLTSVGRTVTRCLSGNMGNSPITQVGRLCSHIIMFSLPLSLQNLNVINNDSPTTMSVHTRLKQRIFKVTYKLGKTFISTTSWYILEVNCVHMVHNFN